ncbi:hypothetical protein SAMN05421741_11333 [Paenimyroides ummariense]|uniref:DUF4468 domain-containing protein n=1 Tax=Paenimyroides ummariense TaxID=913024 RepID=A0A1I5CRJ7_9FLAO|nr:hypothetical protein [Paenimyroides ummariense]SFN89619.1 hypothetical protein SAMN05421741_11333 [Paenimyroides ummariense]
MKKNLLFIISLFFSVSVYSQSMKSLNNISANDTVPEGQAVIYGNFIQRLGFSSGGFSQDIRIINLESNEISTFRVKPIFKTAKENSFCYVIEPGEYAILNYWWTESKWYGGQMFTEPIYKNIDATKDFEEKIKSGELTEKDLIKYTFTITENSLNYLGTWHFNKGLVSFTDDKTKLDKKLSNTFKKLDFINATTIIPN